MAASSGFDMSDEVLGKMARKQPSIFTFKSIPEQADLAPKLLCLEDNFGLDETNRLKKDIYFVPGSSPPFPGSRKNEDIIFCVFERGYSWTKMMC